VQPVYIAPVETEVAGEHLDLARDGGVLSGIAPCFVERTVPSAGRHAVKELVPEPNGADIADSAMHRAPGSAVPVRVDNELVVRPRTAPVHHGAADSLRVRPHVLEVLEGVLAVVVLALGVVRVDPVRGSGPRAAPDSRLGDDMEVRGLEPQHVALPAPARVLRVFREIHGVESRAGVCPALHREISEESARRAPFMSERLALGRGGIEFRERFFPLLVDEFVVFFTHHGADPGSVVYTPLPAVFQAKDSDGNRHEVMPGVRIDR